MFLPLVGFVLLLLLWSAYWLVANSVAQSMVAERRAELKQQGITLDCTEESWGGYPFRFEFTCTSPVVTVRETASVSARSLLVVALAYNPWQAVVMLDGPTTLAAKDLMPRHISHGRIVASATFSRSGDVRVSADIPELNIPGLLTSARTMLHSRPSESGLMDVAASVTGFNYQPEGRPALIIENGDVQGTLMPDRSLSISKIELNQGSTKYWGSGSVTLDPENRIAGKLATETNDLDGLMKILEPHLEMSDQQKSSLRMMLGLLGKQAKADIIARDGQLYIGPFKVADLIPLY